MAGLATTRPLLGLLGLILGHQFDRGFASRDERADARAVGALGDAYARALFQTMGHLAKADGRVTEHEIRAARSVMHRLGLGPKEVQQAIAAFNSGKQASFPLRGTLSELRRSKARRSDARSMFVRLLLEVALAKPRLAQAERAMLWQVCQLFDIGRVELAQMEAMIRAQKGFRRSAAGNADTARLEAAYRSLGVESAATNEEIKTAYRRLINKSHPDKLSSSNPDPSQLAEAERRTREIRGAYELLKSRRSIR